MAAPIGPADFQYLGGNRLGLGRPMRPQRRSGTFEHPNAQRLGFALSGVEGRCLWHGP